ncbi:MAG TPA: MaoC family dehydratase [Acidimicrobiales bacterium]|nr:MaoC family dehydratase [Acidimicrobiales bacterium]
MVTTVHSSDEFQALKGKQLGWSDWFLVDQARVNLFADATDDHQWIHVDPERAAGGPFGGPIAHGYLTLSLIPALIHEVLDVQGMRLGVNYGCNKVRFPAPVKVGSKLRLGATVNAVEEVKDAVQVILEVTLATEGADKPSCVAEVVYRYYW